MLPLKIHLNNTLLEDNCQSKEQVVFKEMIITSLVIGWLKIQQNQNLLFKIQIFNLIKLYKVFMELSILKEVCVILEVTVDRMIQKLNTPINRKLFKGLLKQILMHRRSHITPTLNQLNFPYHIIFNSKQKINKKIGNRNILN